MNTDHENCTACSDKSKCPFVSHGYVVGSPVAPTPTKNTKRGPRSVMAFASPDGVIPGMGDRMPRKNQPRLARRTTEPA